MWLSNHHTWGEGRGYRREALAHLLIEFCSFDPGLGFCEAVVSVFQAVCLYLSTATGFILILLSLARCSLRTLQNFLS